MQNQPQLDPTDIQSLNLLLNNLEEGDLESIINRPPSEINKNILSKKIYTIAKRNHFHLFALRNLVMDRQKTVIPVLGSQDMVGKTIYSVLEEMELTLSQATENKIALVEETKKLHQEDWIKTQFTNIFSELQGVKTLSELSRIFLEKVSIALNSQMGTFYVSTKLVELDKNTQDGSWLNLVGWFGCNIREENKVIRDNKSLVGQCILNRRTMIIDKIPNDSHRVETSTSSVTPSCIIIIPIIYENEIYGAFEIASISSFTELHKKLLEQLSEYLGIPIKNISNMMLTEKLLEEIKKTNNLLESQKRALDCSAIVAETDTRGRITYVNDKFLEISKFSADDLIGQDHRILNSKYHPKEFFINLWTTISKGNIWKGEVRNKAKDGTYYWVDTTIFPVKDDHDRTQKYIAIRFDISYRKEIEEKLIMASESAQKAAQAKTDFLANMSHEIRTPLNTIIGLSDVLLDTSLNEEQQRYLSTLRDSGDTLLSIVNDILDISKIESGQLEIEHVEFNLENHIEQVFEMMTNRAIEKNLEVFIDFDSHVPTSVFGDPLRLRQILMNLITNAIKFTEKGSVSLKITLIKKDAKKAYVEFVIQDTGIGIAKDNLEKIFNSFEQADTSITRKFGGTGLGLSIVKRLVEKKGGNISVQSEYGYGSAFKILLPLEYNPTCLIKKSNIDYIINGKKILVVDDFNQSRFVLRKILQSWGAAVDEASSGLETLQRLTESDSFYDLVILDSRMPDMDGFEVLEKLRSERNIHDFVVLMLTSDHKNGDLKRAKELGISTYVIKPIKKNDLKIAIRRVFKRPISGSVLLLEDDPEILEYMQIILEPLDVELFIAQNTRDALKVMEENKIDLVISDYRLGDDNGIDFLKKMRQNNFHSLFILISGFVIPEKIYDEAAGLSIAEIYSKPFDSDVLTEKVRLLLNKKKDLSTINPDEKMNLPKNLKILAVEDSEKNRQLLKVYFNETDYVINFAENGQEGVKKIEETNDYDLVLMDMQMPVMDGYQAVKIIREKELKSQKVKVPIIALTANALSGEMEKTLAVGCTDYLCKPIRKKDLFQAISRLTKKAG